MEEHNILYFRNLWQTAVKDLESRCENWEDICKINTVPDDVQEEIRSTIGLARLLMNQKLKQFNGLIDDSEFNTGEKEITLLDLAGFWDMVYNEVEKMQKSFNKLQECKSNEWKFVENNLQSMPKKKVPVHTALPKKTTDSKSHALAARQRIAEIKKKMLAQREQQKEQNFVTIEPSEEGVENDIVENKGIIANGVESTILKSSQSKEVKQSPDLRNKVSTTTPEITESIRETTSRRNMPNQRKGRGSTKDKENAIIVDDDISKVKKSRENLQTPTFDKKGKKPKESDFIKLQCITRSAKKRALLAQQNSKENS